MPTRRLLPLLAALVLCAPALAAPPRQAPKYEYDWAADAEAAFRFVRKAERIIAHPERATEAQLVQAGRDLAQAADLSADLAYQPWFHAYLGGIFLARANKTQGPERTALLETARVHFYLAALTHDIDIDRGDATGLSDYPAASVASSFILYHAGLLQYQLGRPAQAQAPLRLLLENTAGRESDFERPEYIQKARTLLATIEKGAASPSKAPPASKTSKAKPTTVKPLDPAAARRVLARAEAITTHPERATKSQLLQAARDLALAAELSPDFQLQPWFHADQGIVLHAQAKAAHGRDRGRLFGRAEAQFYLAALTHGLRSGTGNDSTPPHDVTDYPEAREATASFLLYHLGLVFYDGGSAGAALFPLELLLAAAADHPLQRPEYVEKARTLLPAAQQAHAEQEKEWEKSHPSPR